ncbi:MAG: beta-agarase [Chloroflexi bacterium]|nr:beta-agarase [Chloroflexota bacterium]
MHPPSALESAPGVEGELCFQFMKRSPGRLARAGFYRTQIINKRAWIVDPMGNPWLSLGVCHISFNGDATDTGAAPYQEAVRRRHGSEAIWARAQAKRLKQWGFNTVGCWSSESMYQQGLAYTLALNVSTFAGGDWLHNAFPDVFSPAFRDGTAGAVEKICALRRDDSALLGYFTDNELDWNGFRRGNILFDTFLAREASAPGKVALVRQLRERYHENITAFNTTWDQQLASFDSLLDNMALYPGAAADLAAVSADKDAYLRLAANTYFSICRDAVHTVDPNHMILGVRFAGRAERIVAEECGKYVDIVSFNDYSYDVPTDKLWELAQATYRPVMITEWSFKAMDSGLPNLRGAGVPLRTQSERADAYERYTTQALSLPFVVGLHWFQYTDQPYEGRVHDGENSNYGLVTSEDEPYCTLVERMRQVNARASEIADTVRLS